jgi:uncharacterized protein YdaU (DUF1376 family)
LSVVKTDIWMPVFIGDYLADTMHLTTEQHGAYLLLLFHMWRRGSLRDDDATLAKISGLGESDWKTQRPVLAEFFKIHDGLWQHGRVEKERARVGATKQSMSKKAKSAASSRWSKSDAPSNAQALLEDADSDSDSDSELQRTLPLKPEEIPQVPPLRSCGAPVGMTSVFAPENNSSGEELLSSQEKSASGLELLSSQEKTASGLELLSSPRKSPRPWKEAVVSDTRHVPFRSILAQYWRSKNHASPEMPWQGRDGKALADFLAACPRLNETQFRQMVGNRARSAVTHGDRVYLWIGNQTLTMNYMEGLTGPIHFSQYAGREVAMGAARKWSVDDIAGSLSIRCERQLPANASPFGALRQSQMLIGSSSPDGTVQMVATGIYNDNGRGIECVYETTSTQDLMDVSMLGGVTINALGQGSMTVSVMVARSFADSPQPGPNEIKLVPFPLTPENWKGYDGGARGQNERFRMRFTNGTAANAWFALKYCSLFTRPLYTGRTGNGT